MGKGVISASQFKKFYSCKKQWAWDKLEDIPLKPNINMEIGNLVHKALELFNENHDPISKYKTESNAIQAMENHIKRISKEKVFKNRHFNGFKEEIKNENTVYVLNMLSNYADYIYKNYQRLQEHDYFYEPDTECFEKAFPDKNELSLRLLDDSGSWLAMSTIDAVYEKNPLFGYNTAIIDYKTKSKAEKQYADISSGNELQLEFYAWLFYQVYGVVPDSAGIHFVGTDPKEEHPIVLKDISFHDILTTDYLIREMLEEIESDDIEDFERNKEFQWCGEDYCDHYSYCIGDEEPPEDIEEAEFEDSNSKPVEGTISEVKLNNLTYASNSDEVLK